ncbi:MAG: UDP-N-acetylmuramoyl-L-alanyl-D-glutamate--2,6-diaminopimelate ligase [Lysobacterales bacterium]
MNVRTVQLSDLVDGAPKIAVSGMTLDSRQVKSGDVFVALCGANKHGLAFTAEAIARGCVAVLWETAEGVDCPDLAVPAMGVAQLGRKLSALAGHFYDRPSAALTVVGVTGTNGKSSCVEFVAQALAASGHRAGTIGTLGSGVLNHRRTPLGLTTPDAITVQRELARLRDAGCTHVAMEVSSHALDQGRVAAVDFAVAVVTNISRDHLDYHGSMQHYIAAKARLLTDFRPAAVILNADDETFVNLRQCVMESSRQISFGLSHGDLQANSVNFQAQGCQFQLQLGLDKATVRSELIGAFNVSNLLAVAGVMLALDCANNLSVVANLLAGLKPPAGRMQRVSQKGQPLVVVDYAHTPDALEKALTAMREHCAGELYCIFGCGGNRDRGKRPMMAAVAATYADQVIVTSDNPRDEPPEQIISDILAGNESATNVVAIADRRAAIADAVSRAGVSDAVLVAGKGHEQWQEIGNQKLPFDDVLVVTELFRACA